MKKEDSTDKAYEVKKNKEKEASSPLKKGWKSKSSLRQAFILSEVFKRVDER